jgi:hypothetical protein
MDKRTEIMFGIWVFTDRQGRFSLFLQKAVKVHHKTELDLSPKDHPPYCIKKAFASVFK